MCTFLHALALDFVIKLCISSTINTRKKLLSTAICAGKNGLVFGRLRNLKQYSSLDFILNFQYNLEHIFTKKTLESERNDP